MTVNHTGYRLEEMPEIPSGLSGGALKHWNDLMPVIFELGTARPADVPALVLLCEMRADLDALQDTIRKDGITTEAGSGGRKAHPALRSLEAARRQVLSLLDQFGLLAESYPSKRPKYSRHH